MPEDKGSGVTAFRPEGLLDADSVEAYCDDEIVSLRTSEKHLVLEFSSNDDSDGGWTDGGPWISSLIARNALAGASC